MRLHATLLVFGLLGCAPRVASRAVQRAPGATAPRAQLPAAPAAPGPLFAEGVQTGALRDDGHVLLRSGNDLVDWDSQQGTVRRASLGAELAANAPFLSPAGPRFVVARVHDDITRLELWDTATLAKVAALDGTWATSDGVFDFSADGSRFAFAACIERAPDTPDGSGGWSDCDIDVYAVATGILLHRTHIERVQTHVFMPMLRLSPRGTYVAIGHEIFSTAVFESATGARRFGASGGEGYVDRGPHFVFVDDTHLLDADRGGRQPAFVDLTGARKPAHPSLGLGARDVVTDFRLSPGRTRTASLLTRGDRCRVVVWTFATGASSSHLVPSALGPGCSIDWQGDDVLMVQKESGGPTPQLRIDATAGTSTTEPYAELPAFAREGFRVFGQLGTQPTRRAHLVVPTQPERSGVTASPFVLTPSGAKVPLQLRLNETVLEVVNGRLAVLTTSGVTVVTHDGHVSRAE